MKPLEIQGLEPWRRDLLTLVSSVQAGPADPDSSDRPDPCSTMCVASTLGRTDLDRSRRYYPCISSGPGNLEEVCKLGCNS